MSFHYVVKGLVPALMITLALTALAVAQVAEVGVLVESDFEIPPLAYFDGKAYKPVHVAYVADWEKAFWLQANMTVDIPSWSFKKAVIYIPREAFRARAPPNARGGVLRVELNGTVVELVEAPDGVVATYSYLKPGEEAKAQRGKAVWARPPARRGPADDKRGGGASPEGRPTSQSAPVHLQTASTVAPDGAFIFNKTSGWMSAGGEVCLGVLRARDADLLRSLTVAAVGYNATYIWRTAWYVHSGSFATGTVVGRGVIKVWEIDPSYLDKRQQLGSWTVDLRNGYVTFTYSLGLDPAWTQRFIGLELCFVPYYSAYYTVGANATLGFRKYATPAARGDYFIGLAHVDRANTVAGLVEKQLLQPPIRNILIGPFTLADGYYGAKLDLDMTVFVPSSTSACPSLTVSTYVGEKAQYFLDVATFSGVYSNGYCRYEVVRSIALSSNTVGIWYDEARARDKAVLIKVSFSRDVSEIIIYKASLSGYRFAENIVDKYADEWRALILRGHFSVLPRGCGFSIPQVNRTLVLVDMYTYSYQGIARDYLAVNLGAPSDYKITSVEFRIRPATAFRGGVSVYYKGGPTQETWWVAWAFRVAQVIKTVLDIADKIPGPISFVIDQVLGLERLLYPDMSISQTSDYAQVRWRSGLFDAHRVVAFEIDTNNQVKTIEVTSVQVGTGITVGAACSTPLSSAIPWIDPYAPTSLQQVRHWTLGMRSKILVPFALG